MSNVFSFSCPTPKKLARNACAGNDETFQDNAQHLLLQIVMNDRLLPENADYVMQVGRLPGRKRQSHHPGRAIKKESVARDLVVMSIDAIKIAVEYKRQVFTRPPLYLQVMQRGQGHDFILFRLYGI